MTKLTSRSREESEAFAKSPTICPWGIIGQRGYVYFIQNRDGGKSIKIGATGNCPYQRLTEIRRSMKISKLELLRSIAVPDSHDTYFMPVEKALHRRFEHLREEGEWFRPGNELLRNVRENARVHICNRYCPDGTSCWEEMRAFDDRAHRAITAAIDSISADLKESAASVSATQEVGHG